MWVGLWSFGVPMCSFLFIPLVSTGWSRGIYLSISIMEPFGILGSEPSVAFKIISVANSTYVKNVADSSSFSVPPPGVLCRDSAARFIGAPDLPSTISMSVCFRMCT